MSVPDGRLGDAERLQAQFARGNAGQIFLLLLGAAVPQHRAHGVHLRMAGGAVAARGVDFLHDRRGRRHREPAAAVFFRNERAEKARLGQRLHKLGGIGALAVDLAPVFAGESGAQRTHRFADRRELGVVRGARHPFTSARPLFITTTLRSGTDARKLTTSPSRHISVRMVSPGNTGDENRPPNDATRAGS